MRAVSHAKSPRSSFALASLNLTKYIQHFKWLVLLKLPAIPALERNLAYCLMSQITLLVNKSAPVVLEQIQGCAR